MNLLTEHCRHLTPENKLTPEEAIKLGYVDQLDKGWEINPALNTLSRLFSFSGFDEVMLFTNYVAWLSMQQDHHPRITLEYKTCNIEYHTHSVSGLSINDFICAAHIDNYLLSSRKG